MRVYSVCISVCFFGVFSLSVMSMCLNKREIISYQILASTVYFVKKGLYLVSKHVCSNGSLYCIERINKVVKN